MIDERTHVGHFLAMLGSIMLLSAAAALAITFAVTFYFTWVGDRTLESMATTTPLPAIASLIWLFTVGGTAASIISIVLYGYRSRWFWRCLLATAVLWLFAPPAGTVIGLISLIVLLANRRRFPEGEPRHLAAP
jgi:hypothetical protein